MKNAYAKAQDFLRQSYKMTYRESVTALRELLEEAWKQGYVEGGMDAEKENDAEILYLGEKFRES